VSGVAALGWCSQSLSSRFQFLSAPVKTLRTSTLAVVARGRGRRWPVRVSLGFGAGAVQQAVHTSLGQLRRLVASAPNPSIERTRPGKPGRAAHVER